MARKQKEKPEEWGELELDDLLDAIAEADEEELEEDDDITFIRSDPKNKTNNDNKQTRT